MLQDNMQSVGVDRESTQMEDHANHLDGLRDGLQRALLQYENMLCRLRGSNPEADKKEQEVPTNDCLMPRIRLSMDKLSTLSTRLNNAADELNGIM